MGIVITIMTLIGALTIVAVPSAKEQGRNAVIAEHGEPHSIEQDEDREMLVYFQGNCEKRFYIRADGSIAGHSEQGNCKLGVN